MMVQVHKPPFEYCFIWEQEGSGASTKVKPREVERLRPRMGSRPASDTDDTMWEEFLQGPDSVSTGSSDSEEEGRYNAGVAVPQTTLSSDYESLQQAITIVRLPSWSHLRGMVSNSALKHIWPVIWPYYLVQYDLNLGLHSFHSYTHVLHTGT